MESRVQISFNLNLEKVMNQFLSPPRQQVWVQYQVDYNLKFWLAANLRWNNNVIITVKKTTRKYFIISVRIGEHHR